MWVAVHYAVRLVGDGSLVEDTRSSGYGDRAYGQPLRFELGNMGDEDVLRVLHVAVLDMHVSGRRRARACLSQPDFGYREKPRTIERRGDGRKVVRRLEGDWLIDVEVELVDVLPVRPPGFFEQPVTWLQDSLSALTRSART